MAHRLLNIALAALLCGASGPVLAQGCGPLKIIASVRLLATPDEREVFVPVSLQGQAKYMLLDTGGALNELAPQTVAALGLSTFRTPSLRFYDIKGNYVDHATVVPEFGIGNLVGHNVNFVVGPDYLFAQLPFAAGILGPGILRNYDVAIDFGAKTLTLLSQDHCEGKVVYWPAQPVAVIPMQVMKASGHIIVPVTLDGRSVQALLDTGAYTTALSLSAAEGNFGIDSKRLRLHSRQFGGRPMTFWHRFASLSFGGVAVANPTINIVPGLGRLPRQAASTGTRFPDSGTEQLPDLLIGMDILRHLHIYIAYREQKLYVTPTLVTASAAPR